MAKQPKQVVNWWELGVPCGVPPQWSVPRAGVTVCEGPFVM